MRGNRDLPSAPGGRIVANGLCGARCRIMAIVALNWHLASVSRIGLVLWVLNASDYGFLRIALNTLGRSLDMDRTRV